MKKLLYTIMAICILMSVSYAENITGINDISTENLIADNVTSVSDEEDCPCNNHQQSSIVGNSIHIDQIWEQDGDYDHTYDPPEMGFPWNCQGSWDCLWWARFWRITDDLLLVLPIR
jgi:hypothetical protein